MTLIERLRQDPGLRPWIATLEAVDLGGFDLDVPAGSMLLDILHDLRVPHDDIAAILAQTPQPDTDGWWLLERSVALLRRGLGHLDKSPEFPALTDGSDPFLRYFYVHVFATMYLQMMAWYDERGIDRNIGRRSLVDLGLHMTHHRRRRGYGGLNVNADWLSEHFTGRLFQLGRLQFDRSAIGRTTSAELRSGGIPIGRGEPVLGVHIPDYCGPFPPSLCDESFAMAAEFFPRHFPNERADVVTCHSWLLDRQLADYLAPKSNILAFQRRFTINHRNVSPQDEDFFLSVFQSDPSNIDRLPQDTTLQRAIVEHVRAGKHWYGGVGWCRL
ncbi:MAG: acyltransferase domain-containing protein [Thermomicrobiales bacterium]